MKRAAWIAAFAVAFTAMGNDAGPYVTVYRDDAVAFQVRRDRIRSSEDGMYHVWLRWLWAAGADAATVIVADVDCRDLRVRELAVMRKDRDGKIVGAEETPPEKAAWKSFAPESGAAAAMKRLCEFLPELMKKR